VIEQKQSGQNGGMVMNPINGKVNQHVSSEDPTRSYNLIGSGLNIPKSELKIPSVLIDYN
jgi:hypothetical protein